MFYQRPDKRLLYLVLLSTLLHAGALGVLYLLPPSPPAKPEQVTMVDLQEIPLPPPPKQLPRREKPHTVRSEDFNSAPVTKRAEVAKVPVPRPAKIPTSRPAPPIRKEIPAAAPPRIKADAAPQATRIPAKSDFIPRSSDVGKEPLRGDGLLKPKATGDKVELAKLFPSAKKMSNMEEGMRSKYLQAEQGNTRLMDTDDPNIGGFNRRFLSTLQDRLNSIDTDHNIGIGITVLKITFLRDGTVSDIRILDTSGNAALDQLAVKATRTSGYVGPLPQRWPHDKYNMICAFIVESGFTTTRWQASR